MSCAWKTDELCNKPVAVYCRYERLGLCTESYEKKKDIEQEAKADAGKLQIHMVPMQIVRDIAEVRMYGTNKYGDENNWKKVELIRYIDAMLRHTLAFLEDFHSVDEESGIPHYKHAECNWAFISELLRGGTDEGICGKAAIPPGE